MTPTPILAVANHKGGSGKTITAHQLAEHCAARELGVLALDLDDQGTLSARCGVRQAQATVADLLLGNDGPDPRISIALPRPDLEAQHVPRFDLIPADHRIRFDGIVVRVIRVIETPHGIAVAVADREPNRPGLDSTSITFVWQGQTYRRHWYRSFASRHLVTLARRMVADIVGG